MVDFPNPCKAPAATALACASGKLLTSISGGAIRNLPQVFNQINAAETETLLQQNEYNLVLVNRILDRDGSSGIDLIKHLRQIPNCPPLMLVSNLPDAQAKAVAAGALQGFGKSTIHLPQVAEHLRAVLAAGETR